ncbi:MAG: hypothetical protein WC959_11285 [Kiritimatiellales bacterium]
MKLIKVILILTVLLFTAGCATMDQVPLEPYDAGYRDGYSTGKLSSGNPNAFKDLKRYQSDQQYKLGWDDGYMNGRDEFRRDRWDDNRR